MLCDHFAVCSSKKQIDQKTRKWNSFYFRASSKKTEKMTKYLKHLKEQVLMQIAKQKIEYNTKRK